MPSLGLTSSPKEELRQPFKATYEVCAYGSGKVNTACDKTISFTKTGYDKYGKPYVTDMTKKCKPFTDQVTPYIKKIPYIDTAKNNAPLMCALTVAAVSLPVIAFVGITALLTFPLWGFFAFITAFLWVPLMIVGTLMVGTAFSMTAAVCVIRYFYNPKTNGWTKAKTLWASYTDAKKYPTVHKLFYVPTKSSSATK